MNMFESNHRITALYIHIYNIKEYVDKIYELMGV
jgi:hypothetical protein